MASVKRVLLGCTGVVALLALLVTAWVFWILRPSGKPIRLFVENGWRVPIEVRVNSRKLNVPAHARLETTVEPGPVHLSATNPANSALLESFDDAAAAQSRVGRWSEERVEKRARFYIYNPGARSLFRITDYHYSTLNVPRFGSPNSEEIRGKRWALVERIGFVFTPATTTHEVLTTRNSRVESATVRGIASEPDYTFESAGEAPLDAATLEALAAALRFDPDDPEMWRVQYGEAAKMKDATTARAARRELLRLYCAALSANPCDRWAAEILESLQRTEEYSGFLFPEDDSFDAVKRGASDCLAHRAPCTE